MQGELAAPFYRQGRIKGEQGEFDLAYELAEVESKLTLSMVLEGTGTEVRKPMSATLTVDVGSDASCTFEMGFGDLCELVIARNRLSHWPDTGISGERIMLMATCPGTNVPDRSSLASTVAIKRPVGGRDCGLCGTH